MMPGYDNPRIKARLLVWWTIWGSTLAALILIYLVFARGRPLPAPIPPEESLKGLIGLAPLFLSIVIRWLVLPRSTHPERALVLFITGLSLAEAGGLLGIFLAGALRDNFFVLGLLGIVQYVPFYAKKLFDPKGSGFIPNN